MEEQEISFCLVGVNGKMGREVVKTCSTWKGVRLASAVGARSGGANLRDILGTGAPNIVVEKDLDRELKAKKVSVLVDLTLPDVAFSHAICAIENGVAPVIGTSGLTPEEIQKIENASIQRKIPAMIVPNFSIGAVLGMKFAQIAAKWMPHVEIVEIHHDKKVDAPSGTAIETAKLIGESRDGGSSTPETKAFKVPGVRGGIHCGVPIHSLRLSGILAQQTTIFGAAGETLELKHTVIDRSTYMSGVELSIRKINTLKGLTIGLEKLLSI